MSDPPETDLDYYSRPENYTGSNLQSLQKFTLAKQKQDKLNAGDEKKEKKKKTGFDLFRRYKHILKGFVDEVEGIDDEDEEEEEEDDESKSKRGKYDEIKEEEEPEDKSDAEKEKSKSDERKGDEVQKLQKERDEVSSPSIRKERSTMEDQISPAPSPDLKVDLKTDTLTSPRDSICSVTSGLGIKKSFVSTGRSSMALKYAKQNQLAREVRGKMAREKLRKAILFVKIVLKLSSSAGGGPDPSEGMKTFTDIASEVESSSLKSSGLSFDPSYFKAKKEINISTEVKSILSLPSDQRNPEQVQTAMFGLQIMRSFAEYPLHMQEKLAKVAWYEVVPPKRIIIRQGHFAENFYFILSGQAVVTLLLRDPKTGQSFVKTATIMRRGMSFGELALLHHSRRTATVTSQGTVQLLTIGREDFFDIFMSGAGPDQIPDHIKFVSQCDFMKDWPIERLLEHPEQCLLHFFKRNVVIVKDSTNSEWLYVVKSGSCQVLKQLKGVTPKIGWKANIDEKDYMKLPKTGTHLLGPKVDTGIRKKRRLKSADDIARLKEQEQENVDASILSARNKKFSKSEYSKNPTTKKAHFAPIRDDKNIQKIKYAIPDKCKPPKPPEPAKDPNGGKPQPVFVAVESLKPKDVFGLETIKFEDSIDNPMTVVTLVSRGAECIMLSKEFFAKHANEQVKQLIRHQVCPYPDESTFQDNLQIKANWELYKASLIDDLTSRL